MQTAHAVKVVKTLQKVAAINAPTSFYVLDGKDSVPATWLYSYILLRITHGTNIQ